MNVLALIPAKANSERLPGKNMRELGGVPLVGWAIQAARASALFGERIVVSSEDPAILAYAKRESADTVRRRPELSEPDATVLDVVEHATAQLAWRGPVYVLLPSSPFRNPITMRNAWRRFCGSDAGTLLSIVAVDHPPFWTLIVGGGRAHPVDPARFNTPRPELPAVFRHDGSHLIVQLGKPETVVLRVKGVETVDINTPLDLDFARFLLATNRVPWTATSSSAVCS